MVKTFQIDDTLYKRFTDAVSTAYNGKPYGHIAEEHRAAIEDRIKKLEETK